MGIFTEALEKRKTEKTVEANRLPNSRLERVAKETPESIFIKEVSKNGNFDPSLVVVTAPDSLAAENFKNLRTRLLFRRDCERPKTILVTSTFPGEGKTYVAANLALSIAMGVKEHALLVDCDLRKPMVHNLFSCRNGAGLYEHLTGKRELEEVIVHTKVKKLSLLTAGHEIRNAAELLSSNLMRESVQALKSRYEDRFIVIDSAPCQVASETKALASYVDGIIMVLMAKRSNRESVRKSVEELGKEKMVGIVFNGYDKSYTPYRNYYKKYYANNYQNYCRL